MGATTVWERWNSMRADHSFGPVSMNSFNHYAFGSVAQWLYEYVAGIRPLPEGAGFRRFRLEPMPNSLLAHAEASLQSPQGMISSRWALVGEKLAAYLSRYPLAPARKLSSRMRAVPPCWRMASPCRLRRPCPWSAEAGAGPTATFPMAPPFTAGFPASCVRPIELLTPAMASCTPKWIVFTAPQMDMHSIRPERMVSCIRMTSVWFR